MFLEENTLKTTCVWNVGGAVTKYGPRCRGLLILKISLGSVQKVYPWGNRIRNYGCDAICTPEAALKPTQGLSQNFRPHSAFSLANHPEVFSLCLSSPTSSVNPSFFWVVTASYTSELLENILGWGRILVMLEGRAGSTRRKVFVCELYHPYSGEGEVFLACSIYFSKVQGELGWFLRLIRTRDAL